MPNVTKQCSYKSLLPSLLFVQNNPERFQSSSLAKLAKHTTQSWEDTCTALKLSYIEKEMDKQEPKIITPDNVSDTSVNTISSKTSDMSDENVLKKEKINSLKNELKTLENKKMKVNFKLIFMVSLL